MAGQYFLVDIFGTGIGHEEVFFKMQTTIFDIWDDTLV